MHRDPSIDLGTQEMRILGVPHWPSSDEMKRGHEAEWLQDLHMKSDDRADKMGVKKRDMGMAAILGP